MRAIRPSARCIAVTSQAYASATAPTVPPACGGRGADGPRSPRRGGRRAARLRYRRFASLCHPQCVPRGSYRRLPDRQAVRYGSAATKGFVTRIRLACVGERLRGQSARQLGSCAICQLDSCARTDVVPPAHSTAGSPSALAVTPAWGVTGADIPVGVRRPSDAPALSASPAGSSVTPHARAPLRTRH